MTIQQALIKASKLLADTSKTPSLDAEVLIQYVLKIEKHSLLKILPSTISARRLKKFNKLAVRRNKSEPIAYLINNKEFFGLDFYVDKRVLIPRPETEILVAEALASARRMSKKKISIADVGTGSGCIAVSLARHIDNCRVYAFDLSQNALKVARKNVAKHRLKSKIKLLRGDLLNPLKKKFDIIVANLPYLTPNQIKTTECDVQKYEPHMALLAGAKETDLYQKLLKQSSKHLNKEGAILLEIDPEFEDNILSLANKYFPRAKKIIKPDLAGRNRILIIKI